MSKREKHGWLMAIIGGASLVFVCLACGWAVHAYVYMWVKGLFG